MGERKTLEVVARDRRSGSVVLLSPISPSEPLPTLEGSVVLRPEPGYEEPIVSPVSATFIEEPDEGVEIKREADRLFAVDRNGERVGLEFEGYTVTRGVNELYEVHSAVAVDGDDRADVFAVTDFVETTVAAMGLGACLIIYSGQVWLVKQTLDAYRQAGWLPCLEDAWRVLESADMQV